MVRIESLVINVQTQPTQPTQAGGCAGCKKCRQKTDPEMQEREKKGLLDFIFNVILPSVIASKQDENEDEMEAFYEATRHKQDENEDEEKAE